MIKLVNLLQEQYVSEDMLKKLALEMGETIVEFLGGGNNGQAYLTQSGKVLKFTADTAEVALSTRLKTKRLYKHIVNVYDVRAVEGVTNSYLILMDLVTDPLDEHVNWSTQWNYISRRYFSNEQTDAELLKWITDTDGQWLDFDMDFINKIMPQRTGIKRDFSELRIVPDEAHAGNMGWNRHGNFVHFDAWQREHYTKGVRTRFNGEPIRQIGGKLDTKINNVPYEKGLSKPLQSFKDRNN
jgi:hypothetical protein